METLARSWARVLSWRIITTIIAFVILYVMTGRIALSVGFSAVNAIIQLIFHLTHERIWNRIKWGNKADVHH